MKYRVFLMMILLLILHSIFAQAENSNDLTGFHWDEMEEIHKVIFIRAFTEGVMTGSYLL